MSELGAWTIGRLLTWTTDYLTQHGAESPRLDAEVLLADACGCPRIGLYTAFNDAVADAVRSRFRELVKRRAAGEPVAYLVGRREFFSLTLRVTPEVLIPRPETEHVVVEALDALKKFPPRDQPIRIADVGTGSGAIAIAVAKHAPQCRITAIDASAGALRVAESNCREHQLLDRIDLVEGDLLNDLPPEPVFDLVVSNPPYVSEPEWQSLAKDVKDHEPRSALVGGPRGSEIIARLVPQAAQRLRSGGWLMLEIGPSIEADVVSIIGQTGQFQSPHIVKDLAGFIRVVTARRV